MAHKVRMPRVDANVDEGTVGTWFVQEGDRINLGDELVEIITDKATFEIESEIEGYFRQKIAPEKSVLPVGYILALITEHMTDTLPDVEEENRQIMQEYRDEMLFGGDADSGEEIPLEDKEAASDARPTEAREKVRATPSARRLARDNGIQIEDVASRSDGVIREEDVKSYLRSE